MSKRYGLTTEEDLYGFAAGTLEVNRWGVFDFDEDEPVNWFDSALEARDACDKLNGGAA